jgi:hypothetical protein
MTSARWSGIEAAYMLERIALVRLVALPVTILLSGALCNGFRQSVHLMNAVNALVPAFARNARKR